jgi:hypothetical protein
LTSRTKSKLEGIGVAGSLGDPTNFSHGSVLVGRGFKQPVKPVDPRLLFCRQAEGGLALRFEVKGREYWLAQAEANQFYVFAPTAKGMDRIPVYIDAAVYDDKGKLD